MKTSLRNIFACIAAATLTACGCDDCTTKSGLAPSAFKTTVDGKQTALYTLTNTAGTEVCITNFGGRVVSLMVPDRNGELRDVVLGFDNIGDYINVPSDFGAAIGRYANRIAQGRFSLDGTEYDLPKNNFGHCLHGGPEGWQYKVYDVVEQNANTLKLKMDSPDGDQNFPGRVVACVTYTLTDGNSLVIDYEAESDAPTIINMTNHSYFNLAGDPAAHSVCDDMLTLYASNYTPVDDTYMTTGEIAPVAGTPMDFTSAKRIGDDIGRTDFEQIANGNGYDHNWVLDRTDSTEAAAELYCPESGIVLTVTTDEPGIQVYTGNFLDGTVTGKGGKIYGQRSAVCLETQHYPDSPNKPEWPSVVLRPGEKYTSHCTFAFSTR